MTLIAALWSKTTAQLSLNYFKTTIAACAVLFASQLFAQDCEVTISCPPDVDVECGMEDPLNTGTATFDTDCNGDFEVTYTDEVLAVQGCSTTIARTWVVSGDDGSDMCVQLINSIDTTPPDLLMPDNLYYVLEWGVEDVNVIDLFIAGEIGGEEILALAPLYLDDLVSQGFFWPSANDECDGEVMPYYLQTVWGSEELDCPLVASVQWDFYATDACGNTSGPVTLLCDFFDTTPPVFLNDTEDITVECVEDVPPIEECEAWDSCSAIVEVGSFDSETGNATDSCVVESAIGPGPDWAIWLPMLQVDGIAPSANWNFVGGEGYMIKYDDGTAHLWGTIENDLDPTLTFELDMWFENAADWATWSGMGRWYKDDLNLATPDMLYEDWTYYELANIFSTLTGTGALAGSQLYLTHNPVDYFFGFQCGWAANNKNANFGFSGWFNYFGEVDGMDVEGNGDINVDKECVPYNLQECPNDDEFTYMWFARDDCDNITFANQIITVDDTTPPTFDNCPEDMTVECDEWPIPVAEGITATDNCEGDVEVEYVGETLMSDDGCTQVYNRGWIATDLCGNIETCTQVITVVDTTAPTFTSVPDDITIECDEDVPTDLATGEDNCQDVVTAYYEDEITEGDCPQEYTITRTHYLDDGCGNISAGMVQIITVVDTTPPVFDDYPVTVTVDCEDLDEVEILTATDNCDEEVDVEYEDILQSGGCPGVIQRFYTATDDCGNETTTEQYITLTDTEAPVINNPADETIECDELDTLIDPESIEITDNCDDDVDVTFTETIEEGICEDSYTIIWHWVAEDDCENVSEATTTIIVQDTTNPEWVGEMPEDITVECDEEVPAGWCPDATDNCDDDVVVELTEEIFDGDCPQEYTIERICRAFDNCGNMAIHVSYVYVVDTTVPEMAQADDETYECDEEIPVNLPDATDNCGDVTVTYADGDPIEGDCPQEYSFVRTYTATDECDNSSTMSHTIWVVDTTPPVLTVADDVTIECDEEVPAPEWTATDNCDDDVEVSVDPVITDGDCPQEYVMVRTYTATDDCGNETTATQTITVVDTTPPVLTVADDITIECDEDVPPADSSATDNCDDDPVIIVDEVETPGDCPQEYTLVRTYTATDDCGNSVSATQTITVQDTTAPEIEAGPDATVECDEDLPEESYEASDNCDTAFTVVVTESVEDGDCPQEYVLTRTYTATDACGNSSSDDQVITVVDTTAPELFGVPEDTSINCNDPIPDAIVSAEDNCDDDLTVVLEAVTEPMPCGWLFIRTWCVSDDCGNETCETQTITVFDDEAPEFDYVPEDITLECDDENGLEDALDENATATDNCSEFEITYSESTEPGNCPQEYFLIRCWTATDDCDNSVTECQTISIVDTTPPVFDDYEISVEMPCDEVDFTVGVTALDNCGDVTITYVDTDVSGGCAGSIIRDYTAVDECGNEAYTQQIIYLTDEEAPTVVYCPEDQTIECDEELPTDYPIFDDNCDDDLDIVDMETSFELDCGMSITYTVTATDHCDNVATCSWTVTVVDTTDPMIELSYDAEIFECDMEIEFPEVSVDDNCSEVSSDDVTVEMTTEPGDCPNSWTETYTYTIMDECGNSASAVYTATFVDTTPPQFTFVPEDQTLECDEPLIVSPATADDNCGDATVTLVETLEPGECPDQYAIVMVWTATDECGNTATAETTCYIVDTTPPVFDSVPGDIVVECAEDVPDVILTATDNCSNAIVICDTDIIDEDECGNYMAIVTCTATDACGNSAAVQYSITVDDNTPPVLSEMPEDLIIDCDDEVPPAPEVTAEDNCDDVEVVFTETILGEEPDPDATSDCTIINPETMYYDNDWGMFLQDSNGDINEYYFTEGKFLTYEDGTAHITGMLTCYDNDNAGFTIDLWLENGLEWDEWSDQDWPTWYKDDFGVGDNYLDWWYYLLNGDMATALGWGDYAGTTLTLSHAPSNLYYGFQVGVGASNVNLEYGGGGWFYYEGIWVEDGEEMEVMGTGDLAFDLDCCPEYLVERTWCATDCSGNETCWTQIIDFADLDGVAGEAPSPMVFTLGEVEDDFGFSLVAPVPAKDVTYIKFQSNTVNTLKLEVFDLTGKKVAELFNGNVVPDVIYDAELNVQGMKGGLYSLRLSSLSQSKSQSIIVAR